MNFIEACKEMKKGNKVRRKGWVENIYMYVLNGKFQVCEIVNGQKIRNSIQINDLKTVLTDDWEVYKDEKEMLIKKGKLFDIARFCNRTHCDKCVLYNEDACEGERETTRFCYLLLDEYFWTDDWSDESVDEMYKLIKDE